MNLLRSNKTLGVNPNEPAESGCSTMTVLDLKKMSKAGFILRVNDIFFLLPSFFKWYFWACHARQHQIMCFYFQI